MSDGKLIMGAFGKAPQQGMGGLGAEQTTSPAEPAGTVQVPEETAQAAQIAAAQPSIKDRLAAIPDWMKYSALAVGLTGVGYAVWRMQNKPAAAATRKRRFK